MSTRTSLLSAFSVLFILVACANRESAVRGEVKTGKVVRVVDGDTYDLLMENNRRLRVRIHGIDAPERGQPFYKIARDFLRNLCLQKDVQIRVVEKDRYGRTVAETFLSDSSLAYELVRNGYAWHYRKYSNDRTLTLLESEARNARRGLWSQPNPVPPWEWKAGRPVN